ncbi:hypothetical protein T492DRAFT_548363 [Pavlovales sp. CCMP2436]|nr:hypothetical protein T492DRAFT_548363 [Pavlovales sp. CCMP2436]
MASAHPSAVDLSGSYNGSYAEAGDGYTGGSYAGGEEGDRYFGGYAELLGLSEGAEGSLRTLRAAANTRMGAAFAATDGEVAARVAAAVAVLCAPDAKAGFEAVTGVRLLASGLLCPPGLFESPGLQHGGATRLSGPAQSEQPGGNGQAGQVAIIVLIIIIIIIVIMINYIIIVIIIIVLILSNHVIEIIRLYYNYYVYCDY